MPVATDLPVPVSVTSAPAEAITEPAEAPATTIVISKDVARRYLVLHHFLGYAPSEIAETLGIPPGTARSRLHNAHRAMRAALDADARLAVLGGRSA